MRKSDARVRYTQRVIKGAFLSLLREKPVNKITVKEVCELAELNRATFYAHYSDVYDLLHHVSLEQVYKEDTDNIILGVFCLIVAEVFAIGLKLKEEQDLTI